MTELSPMEQNVYSYIESMIENEGYAPSVRDICRALGIRSTSTAHACLSRLDQKGYIKKDRGNPARFVSDAPSIPTASGCCVCRCSAA